MSEAFDITELERQTTPTMRYTQDAFPPYRFIPGLNPHPHRDPKGHSYGHEPETCAQINVQNWRTHHHYLLGVDYYNFGYWWESHEAWETAWQAIDKSSDAGQYLQGLIQISAAFIKWYSHSIEGAEKLFTLGIERLEKIANQNPIYFGINLKQHTEILRCHFGWLHEEPQTPPSPFMNYPFLKIIE